MHPVYFAGARQVISQSTFHVLEADYVYAKVSTFPTNGNHFLVTQDADEITVITTASRLGELALVERNKDDYRLIALNVSVPFYSVGFLATVGDAFASQQMNVLFVSTYSKDYVLIRSDLIKKGEEILLNLGFTKSI
jgi:hypothetical protein